MLAFFWNIFHWFYYHYYVSASQAYNPIFSLTNPTWHSNPTLPLFHSLSVSLSLCVCLSGRKSTLLFRCEHCCLKIEGPVAEANGKFYHPEHFCCCVCSASFANGQYYQHGGQPYCVTHYGLMVAPKCRECKQPLLDQKDSVGFEGTEGAMYFHRGCVCCSVCGTALAAHSVLSDGSDIFCDSDFTIKMRNRCEGCGRGVREVICNYPNSFINMFLTCDSRKSSQS